TGGAVQGDAIRATQRDTTKNLATIHIQSAAQNRTWGGEDATTHCHLAVAVDVKGGVIVGVPGQDAVVSAAEASQRDDGARQRGRMVDDLQIAAGAKFRGGTNAPPAV